MIVWFNVSNMMFDIILFFILAIFFFHKLWRMLGRSQSLAEPDADAEQHSKYGTVLSSKQVSIEKLDIAASNLYAGFNSSEFLKGAEQAFVWITSALHSGDVSGIRALVSAVVLRKLESVYTAPFELKSIAMQQQWLEGKRACVAVNFITANGASESSVIWTFVRNVDSPDLNWQVTSVAVQ